MFVASITYRVGSGALRARRHSVVEALHRKFQSGLAPALAENSGGPFADMQPQDIDMRSLRADRTSYRSPEFSVDLRLHETSTMDMMVMSYAPKLAAAFLQFTGDELNLFAERLSRARITEAHITAWLPFPMGVCMRIDRGLFLRSWGGVFPVGGNLKFNPA